MPHVKALCILTALCCSALASPTAPGEATPGEAALRFLDAVRHGNIDLRPDGDTAISAAASPEKIEQITRRLRRMVNDLGQKPLRVGQVKTDGDLAAVLVWKEDGYDPSHMRVFSVAMIRRGNRWLPAPVPASFENCGIGYRKEVRRQIEDLERWMLEQQVHDLARLQRDSVQRMQERISKDIRREELKQSTPSALIERFLAACAARREHEILGLIGGLSSPLPEDWAQQASSVELATGQDHPSSPWRLLMSPNVLRVRVLMEEDEQEVLATYACLDTEAGPIDSRGLAKIQLVHLNLAKSEEGCWQIRIPDFLWQAHEGEYAVADENLDRDLLDRFAEETRKLHPAHRVADANEAVDGLIRTLQEGQLGQLIRWVHIDPDPEQGRLAILHAAQVWSKLHGLNADFNLWSLNQLLPLESLTRGDRAAASGQVFSVRKPDRFDPVTLYLKSSSGGWLWEANASAAMLETFKDWVEEQRRKWQTDWRDHLIRHCPVVDPIPISGAPEEGACRDLMERWIKSIRDGDIAAAIGCCARLKAADSPTLLLRNLGYEFSSALKGRSAPRYHHFLSDQGWSAAGLRSDLGDKPSFPLYPIVNTSDGPKILLEIDLIGQAGRSREFLNRSSLLRLGKIDANAAKTLQSLFSRHESQSPKPAATD